MLYNGAGTTVREKQREKSFVRINHEYPNVTESRFHSQVQEHHCVRYAIRDIYFLHGLDQVHVVHHEAVNSCFNFQEL